MPMYDYECGACKHGIEESRRIDDRNNLTACPRCSNEMVLKISVPSVHTWRHLELELETNKPRVYESKKDLAKECVRLGKTMPAWDINWRKSDG